MNRARRTTWLPVRARIRTPGRRRSGREATIRRARSGRVGTRGRVRPRRRAPPGGLQVWATPQARLVRAIRPGTAGRGSASPPPKGLFTGRVTCAAIRSCGVRPLFISTRTRAGRTRAGRTRGRMPRRSRSPVSRSGPSFHGTTERLLVSKAEAAASGRARLVRARLVREWPRRCPGPRPRRLLRTLRGRHGLRRSGSRSVRSGSAPRGCATWARSIFSPPCPLARWRLTRVAGRPLVSAVVPASLSHESPLPSVASAGRRGCPRRQSPGPPGYRGGGPIRPSRELPGPRSALRGGPPAHRAGAPRPRPE